MSESDSGSIEIPCWECHVINNKAERLKKIIDQGYYKGFASAKYTDAEFANYILMRQGKIKEEYLAHLGEYPNDEIHTVEYNKLIEMIKI
jgi:hypothetical protein